MDIFERFKQITQPQGNQPVEPQQQQMPQVDTSDAINSLAGLLVTPEEREARQRKLMENKRKMIGWTALFDGLRQMANLYTASRGANNMQFTDNPYQTIENAYRQEQQLQDGMDKYRDSYARTIYNMQRQADQDKMRQEAQKAQIRWYDTRDEMARMKAENDRLRAEQQASVNEARRKQIELKTKQMEELHPLQKEKLKATIKNTLHNANRPYSSGKSGGRGSSAEDPFKTLAEQLQDNPDIIGPILQQEGYGFYDAEKKEFNFSKNATKGMATTATRRAAIQRSTQRQSGNNRQTGGQNRNTTGTKRKSRTTI